MEKNRYTLSRFFSAFLIIVCLFGELFPWLHINLGFETLKPLHSALIVTGFYCLVLWFRRLKEHQIFPILKQEWKKWVVFVFLAIWACYGTIWLILDSINPFALTEVAAIWVVCVFAFCLFTLVSNQSDVSFLLRVCVYSGIVLAILSCCEVVFGSFVPYSKYYLTLEQKIELGKTFFPPTMVFYNTNDFAAFLLLCNAIVCYWLIFAQNTKKFLIYMMLEVIVLIPTILINSTISNITVGIFVFITCLAIMINRSKRMKIRFFYVSMLLSVFVVGAIYGTGIIRNIAGRLNDSYYSVKIQEYYEYNQAFGENTIQSEEELGNMSEDDRVSMILGNLNTNNTDAMQYDTFVGQISASQNGYGTIHTRIWLIRAGWSFFLKSPVAGNGPESFRAMMTESPFYLDKTAGIVNPHFFYIELLAQYGGVIFILYMIIMLYLVFSSLRLTFSELRRGVLGIGAVCFFMVCSFSIAVIMSSSAIRITTFWMFFLLACCTLSLNKKTDDVTK